MRERNRMKVIKKQGIRHEETEVTGGTVCVCVSGMYKNTHKCMLVNDRNSVKLEIKLVCKLECKVVYRNS